MQRRNYIVLMTRRILSSFFNGLSQQYIDLYIVKLGASIIDLGIYRSFAGFISAFISSGLGFAADLWGRKKTYIIGMLLEIISIVFFALAFDWKFAIIGLILSMVAFFGLSNVENILIADSTKSKKRAFGFGMVWSLSTLAASFSPIMAAFVINRFGGLTVQGIKPVFYLQLSGLIIAMLIASIFIQDIIARKNYKKYKETVKESVEMLRRRKWLQRWVLIEVLGGYVFSSTMPYQMIYAVTIKEADEFILGYMGTASNLATIAISPIIGKMADRYGRVKTLLLFRPFFYISMMIFLMTPSPLFLVIAWALRGIFYASASVFQTIVMELVPKEYRGRWLGIKNLITILGRSPAPIIGGFLYYNYFPELPFIMAVLVDLLIRAPLISSIPETLNRKEYLRQFVAVSDRIS